MNESCKNLVDDLSCDISQSLVAAVVKVGQFFVVDAKHMQNGSVQVVDVDWLFDGS
jgi:hypothetical protein